MRKGISIIIPTINRSDFLKQTIGCLIIQEFELPFEIVIVDQSATADKQMSALSQEYDFIRYFHITAFRGLPEARNYGWQKARYDCLLYLDDDILCEPNLLSEHYKYVSDPDIGIVAGGITEKYSENTDCETGKFDYLRAIPHRGFHIKQNKYVDHAGGGNFSVKKSVVKSIGGIDENLTKGAALHEETDFCLRAVKAGYKIYFNYNAHVHHLAAPTGGCRVEETGKYVFNLSRNRSILITRYLKWYYQITAYAYLLKLIFTYSFHYKKAGLITCGLSGIREGKTIGRKPPQYTFFINE